MNEEATIEFRDRLTPQATALVERATGAIELPLLDAILDSCQALQISSSSDTPMVAMERDVHLASGTYHLNIRRLSSSVPPGKFQILITRDLASGLIS
ncbi:MAG: hypothetical protein F6K28_52535 [Microcoleus sp. SIO2G3]|nr:hypothetical protein [Microcoleus sp. SIO2G3]